MNVHPASERLTGGRALRFHLVRMEEGPDRYTVLPDRFQALTEAQAYLERLKHEQPGQHFVVQVSGLS